MDSIIIKQLVSKQMEENDIHDGKIYILEKDWGYVVQVTDKYNKIYLNEIFDKEGNIIYPLGMFDLDSGPVYRMEVQEKIDDFGRKHTLVFEPSVRFKQLDDNHFIIPRTEKTDFGNVLFFVDETNQVVYKGFIKGKIFGNILTENKNLLEQKQVLVCEEIDETRDEYEHYFYSWDKNCRTSDKWNLLYSSEDIYNIKDFFYNKMNNLPVELVNEIIRYMQEKEAWLAVLKIISKDSKYQIYFISLIGINGLPLVDLIYITLTYKVKTHPLKKEEIGEVDNIKQLLKAEMEQRIFEIEENKKNITANFFQMTGLTMNDHNVITDGTEKQKEKRL